MQVYQLPKGYESFDKVKRTLEDKLPAEFHIISAVEGEGEKSLWEKLESKISKTAGSVVGTINIKKNAYVAVAVYLTSSDGVQKDFISVGNYVPSAVIRFLMKQVLGYVANLIFPAIFGTSTKLEETVQKIIMNNFEAELLDTSFTNTMKNAFQGKGITEVKESSVKE